MNNVKDYNAHFNPLTYMSRADFELLARTKRLWSTRAKFNQIAAQMIMGPAPVGFHYPIGETYYQGYVVTAKPLDLVEATEIAAKRGWSEEVIWLVEDSEPLGDRPEQLFLN